ncbi:MAG TPA: LysR family transcriptional regulator [Acidimicrobiales bacterium]
MDVHVRDLRYFLAVATHGNFTRAAEALYVSQPALSKQIRALERQLRTRLFDRQHRDVRLTRAGQALVPRAEEIVGAWESARRALTQVAECTLVVGMHTSPGRHLLPEVRARLTDTCPDASFEMRQMPWADRFAGLADRTTDAAFVWLPLPQPPYRWITIAREARLVALSRRHRLASRRTVTMADLLDEPFLALPESAGPLRDYWLALDHRHGHPVRIAGTINDTEETYEAVAAGVGVCLLAAGNAPIFARGDVVMPTVTDLSPSELVLAWHERHRPPLLESFIAICQQVLAAS